MVKSSQYHAASDKDEEKYQLGDYWLIQNQILQTHIIGNKTCMADSKKNYYGYLWSRRAIMHKLVGITLALALENTISNSWPCS